MAEKLTPFPNRPTVQAGAAVYEVVEPATLKDLLDTVARDIYRRTEVPLAARHRLFALAAAAAAVNALQEA